MARNRAKMKSPKKRRMTTPRNELSEKKPAKMSPASLEIDEAVNRSSISRVPRHTPTYLRWASVLGHRAEVAPRT